MADDVSRTPQKRAKSALKGNAIGGLSSHRQYFLISKAGAKQRAVTEVSESDTSQSTKFLTNNKTNIQKTPSRKEEAEPLAASRSERFILRSSFKNHSQSGKSKTPLGDRDLSSRGYLFQIASPCLDRAIEGVKHEGARPQSIKFEKNFKRIGTVEKMNQLNDKIVKLFASDTNLAAVLKNSVSHKSLERMITRYNFSASFAEKRKAKKGLMENVDKFAENFQKGELVKENLKETKKKLREKIIKYTNPPCYYKSDFLDFHFASKNPMLRGTKTDLRGVQEMLKKNERKIGNFFRAHSPPNISRPEFDSLFVEGAIKQTYDTTQRYYMLKDDPSKADEKKMAFLIEKVEEEIEYKKQMEDVKKAKANNDARKRKKDIDFS